MEKNFRQEFEKDLANLINRHGMEKVFCDTPDFILAKVAYLAMELFGKGTKGRDRWHGFRELCKKNAKKVK